MGFAWVLPRIGTPVVSVTCQVTPSVFSLVYMYETIDPITLLLGCHMPGSLLLVVIVFVLVIPDQRVPVLCRVALHCILPLYQFQHPPGAS